MRYINVIIIVLSLLIFPVVVSAYTYTLFLKDGATIETTYYWDDGENRIGYYQNDDIKYVEKDKIDFEKTNAQNKIEEPQETVEKDITKPSVKRQPPAIGSKAKSDSLMKK
jgi:hypothetical protein